MHRFLRIKGENHLKFLPEVFRAWESTRLYTSLPGLLAGRQYPSDTNRTTDLAFYYLPVWNFHVDRIIENFPEDGMEELVAKFTDLAANFSCPFSPRTIFYWTERRASVLKNTHWVIPAGKDRSGQPVLIHCFFRTRAHEVLFKEIQRSFGWLNKRKYPRMNYGDLNRAMAFASYERDVVGELCRYYKGSFGAILQYGDLMPSYTSERLTNTFSRLDLARIPGIDDFGALNTGLLSHDLDSLGRSLLVPSVDEKKMVPYEKEDYSSEPVPLEDIILPEVDIKVSLEDECPKVLPYLTPAVEPEKRTPLNPSDIEFLSVPPSFDFTLRNTAESKSWADMVIEGNSPDEF